MHLDGRAVVAWDFTDLVAQSDHHVELLAGERLQRARASRFHGNPGVQIQDTHSKKAYPSPEKPQDSLVDPIVGLFSHGTPSP